MNNNNSFAYKLGYALGVACMCCAIALVIAFTIRTVAWLIF